MIQIELIYQTRHRLLQEKKHKKSLYFLFEGNDNADEDAESGDDGNVENPSSDTPPEASTYDDDDYEDSDLENAQQNAVAITTDSETDIYNYIFAKNIKKINDELIKSNDVLDNAYADADPISVKIFKAFNQNKINTDIKNQLIDKLKNAIIKYFTTVKGLGKLQAESIYYNFFTNSSKISNPNNYITYFNSFIFFPFDYFDMYELAKKDAKQTDGDKKMYPKALKALEKNFYATETFEVIKKKGEIAQVPQRAINVPDKVYKIDNKTLSGMLKDITDSSKDENKRYAPRVKYFPLDLYVNTTSEGAFGAGKGEMLLLSLIKYAKSGGSEFHDLILIKPEDLNKNLSDIAKNNKIVGEIEVKQGKGSAESTSMNLNVRKDSEADKAKKQLLKDLNKFFEKFYGYTKDIDEMFRFSGMYESRLFAEKFIGSNPQKGPDFTAAMLSRIFDPEGIEENADFFNKVKYDKSFDRILLNLANFLNNSDSTAQGVNYSRDASERAAKSRNEINKLDNSAEALAKLGYNSDQNQPSLGKSIRSENQSIYTLLQNAIQVSALDPDNAGSIESKFTTEVPKLQALKTEFNKFINDLSNLIANRTATDAATNLIKNYFSSLDPFIQSQINFDPYIPGLPNNSTVLGSKFQIYFRDQDQTKIDDFLRRIDQVIANIQDTDSITDDNLKNQYIAIKPEYPDLKNFEFTTELIDKLKDTYLTVTVDRASSGKKTDTVTPSFALSNGKPGDLEGNQRTINIMQLFYGIRDEVLDESTKSIMSSVTGESLRSFSNIYFDGVLNQYIQTLNFYLEILTEIKDELVALKKSSNNLTNSKKIKEIKDLLEKAKSQKIWIKEFNKNNLDQNAIKNYRELLKYKSFLELYEILTLDEEEIVIQFKHLSKNKKLKNIKDVSFTTNEFEIIEPQGMNLNSFFEPDDPNTDKDDYLKIKFKNSDLDPEKFGKIMRNKNLFNFLYEVESAENLPTTTNTSTDSSNKTSSSSSNQNNQKLKDEYIVKQNKTIVDLLDACIKDMIDFQSAVQNEYTQEGKGFIAYFNEDSNNLGINNFNFIFNDQKNNVSTQFKDLNSVKDVLSDQLKLNAFMQNSKMLLTKDIQSGPMCLWQSNDKNNDATIFGALVRLREKFINFSKQIQAKVKEINKVASEIKQIQLTADQTTTNNQTTTASTIKPEDKEKYLRDIFKDLGIK